MDGIEIDINGFIETTLNLSAKEIAAYCFIRDICLINERFYTYEQIMSQLGDGNDVEEKTRAAVRSVLNRLFVDNERGEWINGAIKDAINKYQTKVKGEWVECLLGRV